MIERRETHRRRVFLGGRIVHACILSDTACQLRDRSPGGARLSVSGTIPLPDRFDLVVACRGETRRIEVVWRCGDEMGVRFLAGDREADRLSAMQESLRASQAEIARLRRRLAASEAAAAATDGMLH